MPKFKNKPPEELKLIIDNLERAHETFKQRGSQYGDMWEKPHKDSIHDLGVYAFMLEGIDDNIRS